MVYEKLLTHEGKRYYKLYDYISKDVKGERLIKSTRYVVVSDAHTHVERLVFPFYIRPGYTENDLLKEIKGCIEIDYLPIAGKMTLSIDGGAFADIQDDGEYLKELLEVNKYELKG